MNSRFPMLFVVGAFLTGMTFAQTWFSNGASTPVVEADAIDAKVVNRIYEELTSTDSPLALGSSQLAKIAQITIPCVVHIQSERRSSGRGTIEETGSGVLVTSARNPGYYVVTNRHVIDGAGLTDIEIQLYDGRVITPERVWSDADTDVAVLKVSGRGLQAAQWGDSNHLQIGHMVLAMGSPFGLSQSVTYGIISAKGRRTLRLGNGGAMLNQDFLQTDAAINPGNSGGPLIDLQGRVVGINTAIASNSGGNEGIGFSIPSNLVRKVFDELVEHGVVRRAYLGVKLDPTFDLPTARRLGLDRAAGARVLQVYGSTPAAAAGLKIDDVVLKFDGISVQDENHLINLVSLTPIGTTVQLQCWRDKKAETISVKLTDRNTQNQRSELPNRPAFSTPAAPTGWVEPIGLTVHHLTSDLSRQLGLSESAAGAVVTSITPGSRADGYLRIGDVIEQAGGRRIESADSLHAATASNDENRNELLFRVRRLVDGHERTLLVVCPAVSPE